MEHAGKDDTTYIPVADVTVDVVRPAMDGFTLEGRGSGGADYRMEMHLDMRVDGRTRTVLSEILSQSEWRISRRVQPPLRTRLRRKRPVGRSGS
jgi:hypothetical protein